MQIFENFPTMKNDVILRVAKGLEVPYTPVWIMRQAGRYLPEFQEVRKQHGFFDICRSPELACKITLQPLERFNLDAAIIFSDILVIPQILGMNVIMTPGVGPVLPEPLTDASDLDRLEWNPDVKNSLKYVYEAITLTRHELDGKVPLIGFSGAPWTLMAYMIEGGGSKTYAKSKRWLYEKPGESHRLLSLLTSVVTDHLVQQALSGAQLLQVFESHAGVLTSHLFTTFALPCLKDIYTGVHKQLTTLYGFTDDACPPMIIYAKDGHFALKDLSKIGYEIVGLDWTMNPIDARRVTGEKIALQGNLDPCALYSSPSDLTVRTQEMMNAFGNGRHIANLGHGIYPDIEPSKVKLFVDLVHSISKRPSS